MTFVEATAQQLAWERGRDDANEADIKLAEEMTQRWNQKRIESCLKQWE